MCGIYGYVGTEVLNTEKVLAALRHRGPDSQGTWQGTVGSGQIHLLHTRLAILDLTPAGHQPMVDAATGNVVVFNGEIYNFLELRQQLKARGLEFHSHSDTEVLLLGYRVWGEQLVERLDGMFALLLFDQIRQRLLIARDHVGIKPLYYAQTQGGGIAFASEIRALISSGLVATDWDEQSIYDYLVHGSVQEPCTIRRAIKAFPPAHYAWMDLQQGSVALPTPNCYWNLAEQARNQLHEPTSQMIHAEVLQRTLEQQLIADVPVGLFLSAGIDSTALASILAPITQGRLSAFTLDLEGSTKDKSQLAAVNAQKLNLEHHVAHFPQKTLSHWLLDSFAAMDQPSSDGTNTYLISKASLKHAITVVISGCGADELHGGYPHFRSLAQLYHLGQQQGNMRTAILAGVQRAWGCYKDPISRERLRLLLNQLHSPTGLAQERRRFFTPTQITAIWSEGDRFNTPEVTSPHQIYDKPELDFETQLSLAEIQGYLRNTLLRDSDWATMANQQELRVPYLGKRYMETVMRISWSWKRGTKKMKKPLLARHIPPACQHVLQRKKTGFELDYASYLSDPLRDCLYIAFAHLNQAHGFQLNPEQVEQQLKMGDPAKQVRRYWALTSLGFYLHQHS